MIADATLHLIDSEPKTLFTTSCSLPAVLPFSVSFLFFIYQICFFFFFFRIAFFPGGWLQPKPNSSSDMLWNKSAWVWMEIPDPKRLWPWLEDGSGGGGREVKGKVADNKCLLVSDFNVQSPASMVMLWWNMNTPAGPVNMLTKHAQCHFNMPLVCGLVVIYTPALYWRTGQLAVYC